MLRRPLRAPGIENPSSEGAIKDHWKSNLEHPDLEVLGRCLISRLPDDSRTPSMLVHHAYPCDLDILIDAKCQVASLFRHSPKGRVQRGLEET